MDTHSRTQRVTKTATHVSTTAIHTFQLLVPNIDNPTHATQFNIESSHTLGFLHTHRESPRIPTKEIPKEREA